MLIDAQQSPSRGEKTTPDEVAKWLGLDAHAAGLASWDVFDAVLTPGDVILLLTWRDHADAETVRRDRGPSRGREAAPHSSDPRLRDVRSA